MESRAITSVNMGYEGIAHITLKDKRSKFEFTLQNEGTEALGELISIALSGDPIALETLRVRKPANLSFEIAANAAGTQYRTLIAGRVPLTSAVWGSAVKSDTTSDNIIGRTQFTAFVSASSVIFGSNVTSATLRLRLSDINGNDLAYITDNSGNLAMMYTALCAGQDAIVEWTMYILNYAKKNNEEGASI